MKEIWKPILNFEKSYFVSDLGRIKSIDRFVESKQGWKRFQKGKILKPKKCKKHGYHRVTLLNKGKYHYFSISRLVAIHFIPNKNKLPEVNHIDENKSNNKVSNLEWISRLENVRHGTGIERSARSRKGKKRKQRIS